MATKKPKEIKFKVENPSFSLENQEKQELDKRFFEAWKLKKPVSTAPTHSPKNAFEQTVFYINGVTYRVYYWIDGDWYYNALTKV